MAQKKHWFIITIFCLVNLILHLIADSHSGFQGDEFLHISTGLHPAIGYMEFPPLIGWVAFLQDQFHSSSVFVQHIFTHLTSLGIFIIAALITLELGGKNKALFMVLTAFLIAPGLGGSQQLFQPVVFNQFFILLSFYQLVRFAKYQQSRFLLYLALATALGLLAKYSMIFFLVGLPAILCFSHTLKAFFASPWWQYMLLAFCIVLPNLWWQYAHHFPVLDMFGRLYETQLDRLNPWIELRNLERSLNPVNLVLWVPGIVFAWSRKNKSLFRPLILALLFSIAFLAYQEGKDYYFFPFMLPLLIFGAIWWEKLFERRPLWQYPIAALGLLGSILIPFGMPVLPMSTYIHYYLPVVEKPVKGILHPIPDGAYYAQDHWKETMKALREVYQNLPKAEQKDCMIWGKHYSQAGAIDLYGAQYDLPKAFSYHGSFYLWAPDKGKIPKTVIAYCNGDADIHFFQPFFGEVKPVKKVYNPYANDKYHIWQTIFICKKPRYSFTQMKKLFRSRVFE